MTDLVERLRKQNSHHDEAPYHRHDPLCTEAADEIERLRALLEGRDGFIVNHDLWQDFVDQLPR